MPFFLAPAAEVLSFFRLNSEYVRLQRPWMQNCKGHATRRRLPNHATGRTKRTGRDRRRPRPRDGVVTVWTVALPTPDTVQFFFFRLPETGRLFRHRHPGRADVRLDVWQRKWYIRLIHIGPTRHALCGLQFFASYMTYISYKIYVKFVRVVPRKKKRKLIWVVGRCAHNWAGRVVEAEADAIWAWPSGSNHQRQCTHMG